ncbi:MAG: nucleotidyltransferase [Proteobacteria bacterium]|nr:nucleotidyltransferase [Pseudomonadota bacterium]
MTAIVLVGGKRSLINDYPELPFPLIPVAGEPFLFWVTQWLKTLGFNHIVYSAGHFAEKVSAWAQHVASIYPSLCLDVITESRPLGTAGAAALCANRFPCPFTFVVNGNSILLADLRPIIEKFKNSPSLDGIIFGTSFPNAGRFGKLEVDKQQRLIAFKEKQPGNDLINAGIYLLRNELLAEIITNKETSLEHDCFPKWIAQGKQIEVVNSHAPFIDISTPDSLKRAQELITQHQEIILGYQDPLVA